MMRWLLVGLLGCGGAKGNPGNPVGGIVGSVAPAATVGFEAPPSVASPPPEADRTESGLASMVLVAGSGARPQSDQSQVTVHYSGWTTDGAMFDSSLKRGRPATFPLNRVIYGWTEGLQLMRTGETRRFWIPEELAYQGSPGKPAGMLVFDVQLVGVEEPAAAPPVPEDVREPPALATFTETGLAYRVLKEGAGGEKPGATDRVTVHYTGWTTDGEMFDSSVERGRPATFPLNAVIPGWTEGVQLMSAGDSYRFWIPEELAYKGKVGPPAGMLVFDVELLDVAK